jgi:hypothetical protein
MSKYRPFLFGLCLGLSLPTTAWADSSDWEDDGGGSDEDGGDESADEGGDESDDESDDEGSVDDSDDKGGSDTADDGKDGRCMSAAVNPTTALSVGLGIAILVGLRRKD